MVRYSLWYDRIPALLIELNSLLEAREKEVSSGEVFVDLFRYSIFEFQLFSSWIISIELEISSLYLTKS